MRFFSSPGLLQRRGPQLSSNLSGRDGREDAEAQTERSVGAARTLRLPYVACRVCDREMDKDIKALQFVCPKGHVESLAAVMMRRGM